MIIDTTRRPIAEELAPWRELAAKLRSQPSKYLVQAGADAIEMLCLACEEYERRLDRLREHHSADTVEWEAQLNDAWAELADSRLDHDRLDWIEGALRPLPWGGVYATLESDGDSQFRLTMQPSSGDAPFINETGATIRATIDAAREVPA